MTGETGDAASPARQRFTEAPGVIAPTDPDGRSGFLSDVVVELGLASAEAVEEAVELSRLQGGVVEEILVEMGLITREQLAFAIAQRNGHPYVDLFQFQVDGGAARLIPADTARRYQAVPIAFDADGALVVAIADPLDALAVSDIGVITKSETRVAVATHAGIQAVLETLPESRSHTLSARGMDGIGAARSAGVSGWSLANSISGPAAPAPAPAPPAPPVADPAAHAPIAPAPAPAPPPAPQSASPDLESRIDALVAAALDKRLGSEPAQRARREPDTSQELERAQQELARTRAELQRASEEAAQGRAEIAALAARLEQLERPAPPPQPAPAGTPAEPAFDDHLARVMRQLEAEPRSSESL